MNNLVVGLVEKRTSELKMKSTMGSRCAFEYAMEGMDAVQEALCKEIEVAE